jgi:beta-galactosidase GanA
MDHNQLPKNTFCFGTQYYRMAPLREDWERDIEAIKDLGMDTIRYWALWKWAEPSPGNFYFEDLHQLIRLASKNELDVILVIEMDKTPSWVREHVGHWRLTNLDGSTDMTIHNYVNWDHPVIRKLGERFLRQVCREFGNYEHVIYDVWNEPDKPEDAGPISRKKFIAWLKERFSSVEQLVEKLHLPRYPSWEDVPMPASPWDTGLYLLYEEFRTWSIAEQVRWAYEVVKDELELMKVPSRPLTVHVHCDEHPFTFRWVKNQSEVGWDEWQMHKQVDFLITGIHEFFQGDGAYSSLPNIGAVVANLETKRSITSGKYWTTGLAGGGSKLGIDLTGVEPRENLFSLWMCTAHEAKGVVYWQYRVERLLGPETPAWGLTSFDGSATYRTKECRQFISALRPYEREIFDSQLPKPKTAVLYSLKSHIMNETQPLLNYIEAFEGACFSLWINNVTFDVLCEKDGFDGYDHLIIPMGLCLESTTVEKLVKFVEKGGTLVLEAGAGSYNDYGLMNTLIPGSADLIQAAGIQEKDLFYGDTFSIETEFGPLVGKEERRIFEMNDAVEVLGQYADEQPAVVRHHYKKGKVVYFSSHVFLSIRRENDPAMTRTVLNLAGIAPEVHVQGSDRITARMLEGREAWFLFVFNNNRDKEDDARIELPVEIKEWTEVFRDLSEFNISGQSISVRMKPREALVLRIKP